MKSFESYKEFEKEFDSVKKYYNVFIESLTHKLNLFHNSNHSRKYWEIIIGGWVWYYIIILYSHYIMIGETKKAHSISIKKCDLTKNINISSMVIEQDFNTYLREYVIIAKKFFSSYNCGYESQNEVKFDTKQVFEKKFDINLFNEKEAAIQNSYKYFIDKKSAFIFDKMIELNEMLIVSEVNTYKIKESFDLKMRKKFFRSLNIKDEFEYIFWHSLIDHFPIYYLEEYMNIYNEIFNYYHPVKLKRIYIYNEMFYENVVLNFYVAFQFEKFNSKLIGIQHGGGYGIKKNWIAETFERMLTDEYISWGWKKDDVIPMPSLLNLKWNNKDIRDESNEMIYITTINMENIITMGDCYEALRPKEYNDDIKLFLKEMLNSKIKIVWRPYRSRIQYDDNNQIESVFECVDAKDSEFLTINRFGTSMDAINNKKLVVIDHCSTTMLETLSNNIPTVLFWNKQFSQLTEDGERILLKLEEVGVFHNNPRLAVKFISENYNNITQWWFSDKVQEAVQEFVNTYARRDENIIASYIKLFKTGYDARAFEEKGFNILYYNKYKDTAYWVLFIKELMIQIRIKLELAKSILRKVFDKKYEN